MARRHNMLMSADASGFWHGAEIANVLPLEGQSPMCFLLKAMHSQREYLSTQLASPLMTGHLISPSQLVEMCHTVWK